jgi:hypothetical protein
MLFFLKICFHFQNMKCFISLIFLFYEQNKCKQKLPTPGYQYASFDKEQIGIKEPFPVTNLPFTS